MDGPLSKSHRIYHCHIAAAALILGSATLRLIYLAWNCPLDLSPDEAHYWDWSRHLDWSYYSKGPGVAWLIRFSCELFGGFSTWVTGNEMLAVRLPAIICGSLLLTSMYVLTMQCFGRPGLALAVVAAALAMPVVSAGSTLMTIDAPYTCCWGWALVLGHRAVFKDSLAYWCGAGLLVGIGILFKYTMLLWIPSLAFFLLASSGHRRLLAARGFWLMCTVATLCATPTAIWNIQNDWVSLRHVGVLAGVSQSQATIHWLGPLRFLAVQCGLWLVFWFIVWARAMLANVPGKNSTPSMGYLWWMSAPMFLVFLGFAFKTNGGEPNWPVTAYLSGLVLGVAWLADDLAKASGWYRRVALGGLAAACFAGIVLVLMVHNSAWAHPILRPLAGQTTATQPFPLRRVDPTLRLRGWQELARKVDQVRRGLIERNEEPVLAGTTWTMPGMLGFYCQGHPVVYSLGPALGDRFSQYDLWRPNPIYDPGDFSQRTFVIVGHAGLHLESMFASVESLLLDICLDSMEPIAQWTIYVCRGYRGFEVNSGTRTRRGY